MAKLHKLPYTTIGSSTPAPFYSSCLVARWYSNQRCLRSSSGLGELTPICMRREYCGWSLMLTHPFHYPSSDWESYTPRQGHTSHSNQYQHRGDSEQQQGRYNNRGGDREAGGHGRHYGRMQHDDASGPMGEFSHSKGGDAQQSSHANGRDGYLPGFQGVRRREGGPPGERPERGGDRPERHERGDRGGDRGEGRAPYNKRYEDREGGGDGAVPRYANGESSPKDILSELDSL